MNPRYCLLPNLGCVEVQGADASAFLHGQLSRELIALEPTRAPLAGWHDARGRLRALFRVVRLPDRWLLLTPHDMLEITLARLQRFVLRADVKLAVSEHWHGAALVGADEGALAALGITAPAARDAVAFQGDLHWIRVGPEILLALGPVAAIDAVGNKARGGSAALAALAEIRLGIPAITPELIERFVPQMLNLELLDGISFDKGCYPGQEVIARIHNLGSVKRRMRHYAAALHHVPPPGSAIFRNGDAEPVGEVVRAAPAQTGVELLAVVEHDAAQGALFIGADERAALVELPLPYAVPRA